MKHILKKDVKHEVLSLITDITYANVPAWYGATRRDLKLDVICPKARENRKGQPLIVWLCGGAYRVMDRSVWLPEFVYFARRGFVVASVEYRTSNEVSFPAPLEDVKAAIRYLKIHALEYCIDPERVCVMGESAGATLANLAGVTTGRKEYDRGDFMNVTSDVQAVVDFYGGTELSWLDMEFGGAVSDDIPSWTFRDFVGFSADEEKVKKACPAEYVSKDTPPFLIFLGSEDPLGSDEANIAFCEKLAACGVSSEYYYMEGAIHGDDAFYQDEIKDLIIRWLRKNL